MYSKGGGVFCLVSHARWSPPFTIYMSVLLDYTSDSRLPTACKCFYHFYPECIVVCNVSTCFPLTTSVSRPCYFYVIMVIKSTVYMCGWLYAALHTHVYLWNQCAHRRLGCAGKMNYFYWNVFLTVPIQNFCKTDNNNLISDSEYFINPIGKLCALFACTS